MSERSAIEGKTDKAPVHSTVIYSPVHSRTRREDKNTSVSTQKRERTRRRVGMRPCCTSRSPTWQPREIVVSATFQLDEADSCESRIFVSGPSNENTSKEARPSQRVACLTNEMESPQLDLSRPKSSFQDQRSD